MLASNQLELLSPARDIHIAKEAIKHGADAVYIGGPGFGARHNAANSLNDLAELVDFARLFNVKVFVTLNTILHDDELEGAQRLIHQLYALGIDALIVQDMGILELDIPPIELHASTQCDIRRLDKAQFLDQVGFSQLVLARELSLPEIKAISQKVNATLEFFIHGALCVAFSGNCYISHAATGRSANRGDCSQACRLPFTLKDEAGRVVAYDKHLLSMKDNNQTANLKALIDAGVRSFKIEGRYKDMGYVKNITAHYRQALDQILLERPDLTPASSGYTEHFFSPNPEQNFNRGSTDYFVHGRDFISNLDKTAGAEIGAFDSPKFVGEPVGEIISLDKEGLIVATTSPLNNGDGLNFLYKREVIGFRVNTARLITSAEPTNPAKRTSATNGNSQQGLAAAPALYQYYLVPNKLPPEVQQLRLPQALNRNLDHAWQQALEKSSAQRKLAVNWQLVPSASQLLVTLSSAEPLDKDHLGNSLSVSTTLNAATEFDLARNPVHNQEQLSAAFSKLGTSDYYLANLHWAKDAKWFIPASQLKQLRRDLIAELTSIRIKHQQANKGHRLPVSQPPPVYPDTALTYLANVYNHKARAFYARYGVKLIDAAYEAHAETGTVPVMLTKHCLRFSFNLCPKQIKGQLGLKGNAKPMQLVHNDEIITLKFDCKPCEMQVLGNIKPHILHSPQPGSRASGIQYYPASGLIATSTE